ncbi:MAG: hypothetical protein ABI644_11980, partial [Arenimonas sp.]
MLQTTRELDEMIAGYEEELKLRPHDAGLQRAAGSIRGQRAALVSSYGENLDATGHWYSPSKSGFGYSAQFESATEVHVSYIYDANGQPRWLYGQKSYNPAINTVSMLQLSGFCPLCAVTPITNTVVGTMTRTLGPAAAPDNLPGLTNMSVDATFAPPLSGTWSENLPVGMLSARKNCQ